MAFFKKRGDSLSRAGAILDSLAPQDSNEDTTQDGAELPPKTDIIQEEGTFETQESTDEPHENIPSGDVDIQSTDENLSEGTPPVEVANPTDSLPPVTLEKDVPNTAEVTEELLLAKLSEKLGRTVSDFDELTPKEVNIDPELKQLQDWKEKTGLPLSEWSNYNRDFSKMGDMDVAREILAKQYPNLTKEELEYSLQNYVYNEETDDDSDKIKKSIELKKFAAKGRKELEENRLELVNSNPQAKLTQEQQDAIEFYTKTKNQSVATEAAQEAYNTGITKASTSLESIDLNLSDNLTIQYKIPVEVKSNLPKLVAEMPNWYNEDGSYNHENVVKDVAKVTNFESMVKAAYEQGVAVGTEKRIKSAGNITIDGIKQTPPTSTPKGNVTDVVSKITGATQGSKLRFRTKKK